MSFSKHLIGTLLFCLSLMRLGEPVSWAQGKPLDLVLLPGLSKKISLDFRNIDILEALRFLSEQADANIVPTKNVGGRLTLTLKDVTIKDVMDVVTLINELAYIQQGKVLHVMTAAEYERLFGESFADLRQVHQVQLNYANATDMAAILGNMKSTVGKVIADPQTGTIILIDVREKLEQMVDTAKAMDQVAQPQETQIFELKYARAAAVKEEVEKVLTPKVGTLRLDKRTNTLAVTDLPLRMREVRKVIEAFDRKTRQVNIESKVIQIRLGDRLQTGVNWEAVFQGVKGMNVLGTFPITPQLSTSGKVTLGTIAEDNFTAVLEFLQTLGTTDLLSTPQISVVENEEAKILVGTREAYVTSSVTQAAQASTTAEQVTFIDVGIQLKVTPTINQEGFVTMKIRPEVSSVVRILTTALGNQIPIVESSTAETTVMVKDGNTVVIAGLIRDATIKTEKKVPILGSIPLLGLAFRSREEEVIRGEIVFFLTPSIVTGEPSVAGVAPPSAKTESERPVLDILKGLNSVLGLMRGAIEESNITTNSEGEE